MTLEDLAVADNPRVLAAIAARSCDICGARRGEPCRNTIQPNQPLPGRSVHFGRLVDRSRQKGDDE